MSTRAESNGEANGMRERILTVATTLFYRQGYGGTSMNAIAAELDISAPALYWHFKSKQELCFEAIHDELERFVEGLQPALKESTPTLQLSAFVAAYVVSKLHQSQTLKTPGAAGVYSQLVESLSAEQRETLDEMQRKVVKQLRSVLRRGVKAGEFEIENVTVSTFAIISMCEYVFNWFDPDGPLSMDAVGEEYQSLVLAMVGGEG
ncbi:MAG: TetR family transcriptional regulator [Actinobacteria bacterium]|nr:TetR family transcriptional regulator [Actinomycetota bacterium]